MAHAVILLAEGFEEIEAVAAADLLRRAEIRVTLAAAGGNGGNLTVTGSRQIAVAADCALAEVASGALPDAVIVPGGMGGARALAADAASGAFIRRMYDAGKTVGAICAAPVVVLSPLGLLAGKTYTCYPGMEQSLDEYAGHDWQKLTEHAVHTADDTVVDGTLVTSRGPGTAAAFALQLITLLAGADVAARVASGALL